MAHRTGLFFHELIELSQGVVILLLGAFHQAQPLKLCFDTLNPLMRSGSARFPAAKQKKIPFFRGIIPIFFVQVKQARPCVQFPIVVTHTEGRQFQHTLVPALFRVDSSLDVQIQNFSDAGAGLAHTVGIVEGEVGSCSHMGCSDACIE